MYAFPLLRAKVQRPPLRAATLHRDRLIDWLEANMRRRVMFVVADAGYGKTTLLADFCRRSRLRTLWYRLDQDDGNWISFLHYLVAAGREADPEFAPRTDALLKEIGTGGPSRDAIVGTFLRELPALVANVPAALVLDDYHLVDDAPDVRDIMRELVARAPDGLSLIVLSRRNPSLPVARARVRGEFVELTTDDLRFSIHETEQLFRETYSRVLEADVVLELNRRTEGWPASLQLVETAFRSRPASEARSFVDNLSGARGELYDYLAEEVVGDLDASTQRFLMRASILQAVDPELAGLLVELGESETGDLLARSERLGLLARRGPDNREVFRFHPLVRDFLGARLRRDEGESAVLALHRRVAAHVEDRDWHIAAYHYAAAGSVEDLHRVLAASIKSIMAAGEYALVESYVSAASMDLPPALEIALSRMAFERGRLDEALDRAESAHSRLAANDGSLHELALSNLAAVHRIAGNFARAQELSTQLSAVATDRTLILIARATAASLEASTNGSLASCEEIFETMADDQRTAGQVHYLAVTLLNLGYLEKARGNAEAALRNSMEAIDLFEQGSTRAYLGTARTLRAWALAHLGEWALAKQEMAALLGGELASVSRGETLVECADILTLYGGSADADYFISEIKSERSLAGDSQLLLPIVQAERAIRGHNLNAARAILSDHERLELCSISGHESRKKMLRAYVALASCEADAVRALEDAQSHAAKQGATFYANTARVLTATSMPKERLNAEIVSLPADRHVYLSIVAEAVCARLGDLSDSALGVVTAEAQRRPDRWRDAVRPKTEGVGETSIAAARILERIGSKEDVPVLRALARRLGARTSGAILGRDLARRLAPKVFVEDQGRVKVVVAGQALPEVDVRRKVLALLCYLISRPGLSATRDEVLEALWPGAEPSAGLNSLNQTVYFLRRVLENPYVEDRSPGYVHHDSDVLWLDSELVSSRTVESRRLLDEISRKPSIEAVERLSEQYRGKFALDFAYEDWAAGYRDNLHAAYLEAIEQAVLADMRSGQFRRAIGLARRALAIDSSAEQMERHLLRLYHHAGSHAAAAEQFSHYASVLREELGLEPPTLDEVLSE